MLCTEVPEQSHHDKGHIRKHSCHEAEQSEIWDMACITVQDTQCDDPHSEGIRIPENEGNCAGLRRWQGQLVSWLLHTESGTWDNEWYPHGHISHLGKDFKYPNVLQGRCKERFYWKALSSVIVFAEGTSGASLFSGLGTLVRHRLGLDCRSL